MNTRPVVLSAVLLIASGCNAKSAGDARPSAPVVRAESVSAAPAEHRARYSGVVRPNRQAELDFKVSGYLPFLAVPDDIGRFIRSLPVVMTISLLAAWALSLTIVPMVGAALLRAPKRLAPTLAERRQWGFGRIYAKVATWTLRHRAVVLVGSFVLTLASIPAVAQIKTALFPKDLSYLSYVDIWAPEDATVSETRHLAEQAAGVLNRTLEDWGKTHPDADGRPRHLLKSLTTFIGGGGPRFWFSVVHDLRILKW